MLLLRGKVIRCIAHRFASASLSKTDRSLIADELARLKLGHFRLDDVTNVTPKILSHLNRSLLTRDAHPLSFLRQRIENYFNRYHVNNHSRPLFTIVKGLNPVVSVEANFDSVLVPPDHVSRSRSDTYYLNADTCLRTHTSAHQSELLKSGLDAFLCFGDVYRRDDVDSTHFPVFHQVEGVRLFTKFELNELLGRSSVNEEIIVQTDRTPFNQESHPKYAIEFLEKDIKSALLGLVESLFGPCEHRWTDSYFPFTHPSWELEIRDESRGDWLEVCGFGVIEQKILRACGAGENIGWAFGFGLERLAMRLYQIPDIRIFWSGDEGVTCQFEGQTCDSEIVYRAVSRAPPCHLDMSFWLDSSTFDESRFLEIVREEAGDLIEQVRLIDLFRSESDRVSRCYRLTYRSMTRPLTIDEANQIHERIRERISADFNVEHRIIA